MVDELTFEVDGFPPAKNEALSMLGMGHSHAPRVLKLLEAARQAIPETGWQPLQGPIGLEVTLFAAPGLDPWDATNYLGGIADVLEVKDRRGVLEHLGPLRTVALYQNDRQIKEVHYKQVDANSGRYRVRIFRL
jgi:hypothetical protein